MTKEKTKDLVYVSVDCESTGICIDNVDILQIGAVIDTIPYDLDPNKLQDIDELPTYLAYFLPPNGIFKGESQGLAMNAKILQFIADKNKIIKEDPSKADLFVHPQKFGNRFKKWLLENSNDELRYEKDKVYTLVAGKNFDKYDRQLLSAKTDIDKHIVFRGAAIDPGILMLQPGMRKIPSLYECKEYANIESVVTHDALDDAFDVIECLRWHYIYSKY